MKQLIRIPKAGRYAIYAFVVVLIALWAIKSRGEDLVFQAGSTVARGYTPVIGVDIRWPEAGPVRTDYELGFRLIGESTYRDEVQSNQIALHASLVDGYKCFRAGLGFAYLTNTDIYNGGNVNFHLLLACAGKRVSAQYEHLSCAGSCDPNLGRDMVVIGWRF